MVLDWIKNTSDWSVEAFFFFVFFTFFFFSFFSFFTFLSFFFFAFLDEPLLASWCNSTSSSFDGFLCFFVEDDEDEEEDEEDDLLDEEEDLWIKCVIENLSS